MDYGSVLRELTKLDHWLGGNRNHSPSLSKSYHLVRKCQFTFVWCAYFCSALQYLPLSGEAAIGCDCKWQKSTVQPVSSLTQFDCKVCGVEAFTTNGKRPKDCKRGLKVRSI
jgi:hypothetical protein